MYCGDETGSFIGDVGSCSARFGYGGNNAPSYVVPSIVMTQEDNAKILKSSIPASCYNYKYGHPNDSESVVYDYRVPMRRVRCPPNAQEQQQIGPITDPSAYLQQGDTIDDWDAYEHLWMNAIDTLSVKNIYKHTTGQISSTKSGIKSSTIRSSKGSTSTIAAGDNHCTHPFLVISPGITHPMVTDNTSTNTTMYNANRNKKEILRMTELMMEKFDARAMFVAPTPMLCAFAHGRQTALVVDIGCSGTRITPVVDGLLLHQSQRRSGRGTDWIQNCIWQALLLQQEQQSTKKFNLTPRYQVKQSMSKLNVNKEREVHSIFHRWAMNDLMYEIRTSEHIALPDWWYDPTVPFIYDDNDDAMMDDDSNELQGNAMRGNYYELPDGTRIDLSTRIGKDICRVPELFFSEMCPFAKYYQTNESQSILNQHETLSNKPLHQLIHESLSAVPDVDVRRELASTIVLTGGGSSSLHNLASRLSLELSRITSSAYKPKVLASGYGTTINANSTTGIAAASKSHQSTSVERQCSAWIGGSILSSLGSFQQLWLSKAEYEEYGGTLAIQRFP
jgi:actin-related protein